jgi:hypothetical protein
MFMLPPVDVLLYSLLLKGKKKEEEEEGEEEEGLLNAIRMEASVVSAVQHHPSIHPSIHHGNSIATAISRWMVSRYLTRRPSMHRTSPTDQHETKHFLFTFTTTQLLQEIVGIPHCLQHHQPRP